MSTETNNKTPTESQYCICNKSCPIHTEIESSIEDQLEDLLNEENIIHIITTVISVFIFGLIYGLYIKMFGPVDIIYMGSTVLYKEDIILRYVLYSSVWFGAFTVIVMIYIIIKSFLELMLIYIKRIFSFDLIYTF